MIKRPGGCARLRNGGLSFLSPFFVSFRRRTGVGSEEGFKWGWSLSRGERGTGDER